MLAAVSVSSPESMGDFVHHLRQPPRTTHVGDAVSSPAQPVDAEVVPEAVQKLLSLVCRFTFVHAAGVDAEPRDRQWQWLHAVVSSRLIASLARSHPGCYQELIRGGAFETCVEALRQLCTASDGGLHSSGGDGVPMSEVIFGYADAVVALLRPLSSTHLVNPLSVRWSDDFTDYTPSVGSEGSQPQHGPHLFLHWPPVNSAGVIAGDPDARSSLYQGAVEGDLLKHVGNTRYGHVPELLVQVLVRLAGVAPLAVDLPPHVGALLNTLAALVVVVVQHPVARSSLWSCVEDRAAACCALPRCVFYAAHQFLSSGASPLCDGELTSSDANHRSLLLAVGLGRGQSASVVQLCVLNSLVVLVQSEPAAWGPCLGLANATTDLLSVAQCMDGVGREGREPAIPGESVDRHAVPQLPWVLFVLEHTCMFSRLVAEETRAAGASNRYPPSIELAAGSSFLAVLARNEATVKGDPAAWLLNAVARDDAAIRVPAMRVLWGLCSVPTGLGVAAPVATALSGAVAGGTAQPQFPLPTVLAGYSARHNLAVITRASMGAGHGWASSIVAAAMPDTTARTKPVWALEGRFDVGLAPPVQSTTLAAVAAACALLRDVPTAQALVSRGIITALVDTCADAMACVWEQLRPSQYSRHARARRRAQTEQVVPSTRLPTLAIGARDRLVAALIGPLACAALGAACSVAHPLGSGEGEDALASQLWASPVPRGAHVASVDAQDGGALGWLLDMPEGPLDCLSSWIACATHNLVQATSARQSTTSSTPSKHTAEDPCLSAGQNAAIVGSTVVSCRVLLATSHRLALLPGHLHLLHAWLWTPMFHATPAVELLARRQLALCRHRQLIAAIVQCVGLSQTPGGVGQPSDLCLTVRCLVQH